MLIMMLEISDVVGSGCRYTRLTSIIMKGILVVVAVMLLIYHENINNSMNKKYKK